MTHVKDLLEGYKRFHKNRFLQNKKRYEMLATEGQTPKTVIIGCSDSRVDPSILFDVEPGDIFVIRNVANLVPPYHPKSDGLHGTSAALEFALKVIKVEHIVVLGHSGCAGIEALVDNDDIQEFNDPAAFSFVSSWVDISKDAKKRTLARCAHDDDEKYTICEQESIITSIENLMTFPWIKERVDNKAVHIHGWYYTMREGRLDVFDQATNEFIKTVEVAG